MNGTTVEKQPLKQLIDTPYGRFKVELDWLKAQKFFKKLSQNSDAYSIAEGAKQLAEKIAPIEVVCPPMPIEQLDSLRPLVHSLRAAGALGTRDSVLYAFGVHINPELNDYSPKSIIRHLQAFVIAQRWLVKKHKVDLTRRITPFVDLFPKAYCQRVLSNTGEETLQSIVEDYLRYNPTRNRALDMLPLFKYLLEEDQPFGVEDELVNARPTFHYRLPNCEIDDPEWDLEKSWSVWLVVEKLAASKELEFMRDEWIDFHKDFLNLGEEPWHKRLDAIHAGLQ